MNEPRAANVRHSIASLADVYRDREPRVGGRYVVAVAAVAVAAAARWLLQPWLGYDLPFLTFYFALLVAAGYGGLRPGLLSIVLGVAIGAYVFSVPAFDWRVDSLITRLDALRFVVVGALTAMICEALHYYRRRAEQREEMLRVTLASIGDGVVATDVAGRVTYLNPVAETLTGWTSEAAAGRALESVFRIVNEETRGTVENPATRALREGVVVGLANHTLLIARDGTERPIDDSASPIRDAQGRVFGCVLIFRDVGGRRDTERELLQREAELRERHDELQGIYDTAPVGMALLDRDLRFVRVNDRLAEINGISAAEHVGRTLHEIVPNLADRVEAGFRRVLETGEPVVETEVSGETRARPGVVRTWLESWYPLRDADGGIAGLTATVMEITDRKRDEARIHRLMTELKSADRRKDEFLATLAHELRGPLAPLTHMLEVIKHAPHDGELLRQARDTMDRQLGQLVRLVDDLLDVGRITRDKLELRMGRVELASVMHHAAETCRPMADERRHTLVVGPPAEPLFLHADAVRLAQVFGNLLNNACKYTEPQGRIEFVAERDGREVVVRVRDSGIGIPRDKLDSIFGMFAQVDDALDRSQGGLGIGLMLVKRLVQMHGGTVEARSDGRGCGSEFVVRLPILAEAASAPAGTPDDVVPAASGRRILVVDDNEDAAASLAILLKITGNDTHVAHDGPAALDAAQQLRPDVIVLDIGLPGLSGGEVCRRLREQPWGKDIFIIALTGWGQDEDRRRTRDDGFDEHLTKPVDFKTLTQLLAAPTRRETAG